MSARDEYWEECISGALEDAGMKATKDQIDTIAGWVAGAHENYGMAFGDDVASSNRRAEIEREKADLLRQIENERNKITCKECKGSGRRVTYGGTFMSDSECWKCRGEGRHLP